MIRHNEPQSVGEILPTIMCDLAVKRMQVAKTPMERINAHLGAWQVLRDYCPDLWAEMYDTHVLPVLRSVARDLWDNHPDEVLNLPPDTQSAIMDLLAA